MNMPKDLSHISASTLSNFLEVFRVPQAFFLKSVGHTCECFRIINGQISKKNTFRIPEFLVKTQFERWPNVENIVYKKPSVSFAAQIKTPFYVENSGFESTRQEGLPGDYLITRESGMNEICRKIEFYKCFVDLHGLKNLPNPLLITGNDYHIQLSI